MLLPGGGWEAVKVALRSVWMVLDFSLVGPLSQVFVCALSARSGRASLTGSAAESQVPMAVRVLSFYFADKLRGKDNGILRDVSYGEKAHQVSAVLRSLRMVGEGTVRPCVRWYVGEATMPMHKRLLWYLCARV